MDYRSPEYTDSLIAAILAFQSEKLMSEREVSLAAWLSSSMISKIKNKQTTAKLSTI